MENEVENQSGTLVEAEAEAEQPIDFENMSAHEFIVHKIDQFLIETGMMPYQLGLQACGTSKFYDRLLSGKVRLQSIADAEQFMIEERARRLMVLLVDAPQTYDFEDAESEAAYYAVHYKTYADVKPWADHPPATRRPCCSGTKRTKDEREIDSLLEEFMIKQPANVGGDARVA